MERKYVISISLILSITIAGFGIGLVDLSGDGLPAYKDVINGTNPFSSDTDEDGLTDASEIQEYKTDPLNSDTDEDGLDDGAEIKQYETDPIKNDTDEDGLSDGAEAKQYDTSPTNSDTDDDNLSDGAEVNEYETNPLKSDTDEDGLNDGEEVTQYGTDPLVEDTDEDGLSDGTEVNEYSTDPADSDTDSDGLEDGPEVNEYNTDPTKFDTDGDKLSDSQEIEDGTDPLKVDTDEDLLDDGEEIELGTNPVEADTSGDGFIDGIAHREDSLDPTRHNIVIQVSYMEGVDVPERELQNMKLAFENAPTTSKNGENGINFTIIIDEDPVEHKQQITLDEYKNSYYQSAFESGTGKYHILFADEVTSSHENVGGVTARNIDGALVADLSSEGHETYATMHELGHQLGLTNQVYAGVDSREDSWLEYPSVMNYSRPTSWEYTYSDGKGYNDWEYIEQKLSKNQASSFKLVENYTEESEQNSTESSSSN